MIGARNIATAAALRRTSLLVGRCRVGTSRPMIQQQILQQLTHHHPHAGRSSIAARSFVSRTATQWMPVKTVAVSVFSINVS